MNDIDTAIQKFTKYIEGSGDFDELDLKEVIYKEVLQSKLDEIEKFIVEIGFDLEQKDYSKARIAELQKQIGDK